MSELAYVEKADAHVSVIRLNKPERLNSMSFGLVEALYEAKGITAERDIIEAGDELVARYPETGGVVLVNAPTAPCARMPLARNTGPRRSFNQQPTLIMTDDRRESSVVSTIRSSVP